MYFSSNAAPHSSNAAMIFVILTMALHLLHREVRALGAPGGFRLAEGRDLDLHDAGLRPDDVEVRAVAAHGVVGVHAVRQQMLGADAFAAILLGLPRTDRRAGNLSDHAGEDDVALELNAALSSAPCRRS